MFSDRKNQNMCNKSYGENEGKNVVYFRKIDLQVTSEGSVSSD